MCALLHIHINYDLLLFLHHQISLLYLHPLLAAVLDLARATVHPHVRAVSRAVLALPSHPQGAVATASSASWARAGRITGASVQHLENHQHQDGHYHQCARKYEDLVFHLNHRSFLNFQIDLLASGVFKRLLNNGRIN